MLHTEYLNQQTLAQPTDRLETQPRRWRIYFNARSAFPHIWSVDEGSTQSEVLVQWFNIRDCNEVRCGNTPGYNLAPGAVEQPVAWIEVFAMAIFGAGGVTFYGQR